MLVVCVYVRVGSSVTRGKENTSVINRIDTAENKYIGTISNFYELTKLLSLCSTLHCRYQNIETHILSQNMTHPLQLGYFLTVKKTREGIERIQ